MRRSALLVVAVAACGRSATVEPAESLPAAKVTCAAVVQREIDELAEVNGVIAPPPKLDAIVSSPVAGRVAQVAVEEGDRVAAGALLAVVEDPALPAGSVEAHAGVATAQAAKQAADQELVRQTRLVDSGIGARRDLDDAKAKAAAAAAELDAATARDHLASQRLARRELRAPHAGVVLHVWRRTGESVDGTAATPIAEVADVAVLEVRAQVPPALLVRLHDGMTASVHVLGTDAALAGTLARVAPAVDPQTLLGTVRIQLAEHAVLPVGMSATAQITLAHHPGVVVPATALRRSAIGADEVIACAAGKASVRAVTIGQRRDNAIEIASGLAPGEQVVVDHVLGLEDGQALEPGT